MSKSIEELIYEETDKRLKQMSSPDYLFPKQLDKIDVIVITALIIVSMLLIILCMTGVIV